MSLVGAGLALILWLVTENALVAIILVTIIDLFGFFPTFRKSFYKPQEETVIMYFLAGVKFLISIFALENYSLITYLYPGVLVVMNFAFVSMLVVRRKILK